MFNPVPEIDDWTFYNCMIDEAIELMQPDAEVTDGQIARLEADDQLREVCEDIFTAQTVLARQTLPQPDVEAALSRFHERHGGGSSQLSPRARLVRLSAWIAVAAALVGAVLLFRPHHPSRQEPVAVPVSEVVFTAATTPVQPTVQTATGKSIPVIIARQKGQTDATVTIGNEQFALDEQLQLTVPYGSALQMGLPDGTRVHLHPGARLVYPVRFTGSQRQVQLTGEAYFCVAHDTEHPFVVSTPHGEVRDYGTEFNIETTSNRTDVVLVKGSVGVTPHGGQEQMLRPGQMMKLTGGEATIEEVDEAPYESWRDGYFHFEEALLAEILAELGRYYNISVVSYHPEHLNYRMRFIIPRDHDVAYAVKMLNRMGKVSLTLDGDQIIAY